MSETPRSIEYRHEQELAALRAARDAAVKRAEEAEAAIKKHHAQKADDRCWLDDAELYKAIGLPVADVAVGDKGAMLKNCQRFIERRCEGGKWPTYAELEARCSRLRKKLEYIAASTGGHAVYARTALAQEPPNAQ